MISINKILFTALAALMVVSSQAKFCPRYRVLVIRKAASHPAGLKPTVEKYRGLLGGVNNGNNPGPIAGGQRSIDWDAAAVPFNMPFNFFDKTVTRGALFVTKGNKFAVSNPANPPPVDDRFSSLLPKTVSKQFRRFSLERLFTPVKDNVLAVLFKIPAKNKRARVRGFGAVFTDVDQHKATQMLYYDKNGCLIAKIDVPPKGNGLSFTGIVVFDRFGKKQIAAISKVVVKLGTISVHDFGKKWNGNPGIGDVVVMDDLFYAEPEI